MGRTEERLEGSDVGLGPGFYVLASSCVLGAGTVELRHEDRDRAVGFLDWAYNEPRPPRWGDADEPGGSISILRAAIHDPDDRRKGYGTALAKAVPLANPWTQGLPIADTVSSENTGPGNAFVASLTGRDPLVDPGPLTGPSL